jgi:hypothetical protein
MQDRADLVHDDFARRKKLRITSIPRSAAATIRHGNDPLSAGPSLPQYDDPLIRRVRTFHWVVMTTTVRVLSR